MKFNLLTRAFALKFTDEGKRPAPHPQMGPVMLDLADFVEGAFVDKKAGPRRTPSNFDQTGSPVVTKQVRMNPGQIGRSLERKRDSVFVWHAHERERGVLVKNEIGCVGFGRPELKSGPGFGGSELFLFGA